MTTALASLRGLDLAANVDSPISSAVASFYSSTLAKGTGPNGTFLITDLLPGASGIRENPALAQAQTLIGNDAVADLGAIYAQMVGVADSSFGTPPTIVLVSGPAAGTYATYDDALQALYVAADAEIGNIRANSLVTTTVASSNDSWTVMARGWAGAPAAQANASIALGSLPSTAQLPVTAFIAGLDYQGTNTEVGMSAQYLQAVANIANPYGQALVGALRQSRNNADLDSAGVGRDNAVPDRPPSPPPQADLGPDNYTVSEARIYVQSQLST